MNYIQIGASNGLSHGKPDGFFTYIQSKEISKEDRIILVEPNSLLIPELKENWSDYSENIEDKFQEKEFFSEITHLLSDMAKEDRILIDLFYRKGFSQKEISVQLNQSESKISRSHNRILGELKGRLKDVYNNC